MHLTVLFNEDMCPCPHNQLIKFSPSCKSFGTSEFLVRAVPFLIVAGGGNGFGGGGGSEQISFPPPATIKNGTACNIFSIFQYIYRAKFHLRAVVIILSECRRMHHFASRNSKFLGGQTP